MNQKKYQIFVSSTFRDLIEERIAILEAVLEFHHIPCGMEAFPASSNTPWELIKNMIDESDYYVLVIGGKYGSVNSEGISYTEMEYEYAVSSKKAILCFLHQFPDRIPVGKTEVELKVKKKLLNFQKKVQIHHCKYWADKDDLKSKVITSLSYAFATNPQAGWVKYDGIDKGDLLYQLNELRNKYDKLLNEYENLKSSSIDVLTGKEILEIPIKITIQDYYKNRYEILFTLSELFWGLGSLILNSSKEYSIKEEVIELILLKTKAENGPAKFSTSSSFNVLSEGLDMLKAKLLSMNLITINNFVTSNSNGTSIINKTWSFTEKGLKLYSERF